MKRYIKPRTILCAVLCGVIAGIASFLFDLTIGQSIAIGAITVILSFFVIPSHFVAKNRVFDREAKKLAALYINEPILIITNKKTYRGRLCVSSTAVNVLFLLKGRVFSLVFKKEESPRMEFNAPEGLLSIACEQKGACITSGEMLRNIYDIADALEENGWIEK